MRPASRQFGSAVPPCILVATAIAGAIIALCYPPYRGCGQFLCGPSYVYFRNTTPLSDLDDVEYDHPLQLFQLGLIAVTAGAVFLVMRHDVTRAEVGRVCATSAVLPLAGLWLLRQYDYPMAMAWAVPYTLGAWGLVGVLAVVAFVRAGSRTRRARVLSLRGDP